jgi:hypothetical protein
MTLTQNDKKRIRSFAIIMAVALSILGGLLFWWDKTHGATVLWSVGGAMLVLGMVLPVVLWPLERIWFYFAVALGWLNTRILLSVVFYLIITPTGWVMRLFRKDVLERQFRTSKETYWHDISDETFDPENYERQY